MDVDLPVWTIRPNWAGGVLERLEWLTDVQASDTGVEQRLALRLSPRRSFEITVNPTRADRTYLDLVLHRLGSARWLFPLWHDQAALGSNIGIGIDTLPIDNTFREFRPGDYAILYHNTFTWEVVSIADMTANSLELVGGVERAWPRGTKVYPLRIARIQTDTSLSALTSRVGQSVLLFQLEGANEFPEMMGDAMATYNGSPLLTMAPNRIQEITTAHTRLFDESDGQTGIVERVDTAGRAFAVQSHNWQVHGREAQMAFRSFLYTLRGRQRKVWLPTFNEDVVVAEHALAGAVRFDIDNIGMAYVGAGSPIPGRARVWSGTEVALIAAISASPGTDNERLATVSPLQGDYAPGDAWSFLQAARLDQDSIELHHNADSDGVLECAAGFHTFADDRDPSGTNFVPPPLAGVNDTVCGAPLGLNPCFPIFPGWYTRYFIISDEPCKDVAGGRYMTGPDFDLSNGAYPGSVGTHAKAYAIEGLSPSYSIMVEVDQPHTNGSLRMTTQYPGGLCTDVGKAEYKFSVYIMDWQDRQMVKIGQGTGAGLYPYDYSWEV
jgi:hypothetical protein